MLKGSRSAQEEIVPIPVSVIVAILAFNVLFVAIRLHASRPRRAADSRAPSFGSSFLTPTYATLIAKEYPRAERPIVRPPSRRSADH